ncbi:MAG: flippase, partial [FCB group bacterium]
MKQSRKILKNMFSLTVAEASSKGIVFIYNAYLARVILPEGFGIIGFASAYLMYFLLFVNLGFNTVGIREIAKSHSNTNKYVNSIIGIRALFAVIAFAMLFFSTFALDKPMVVKYIIWISGINLFSNAILLDWVFHGNERMEFLGLRQFISSLLNLIGVVLLVHNQNDVIMAMVVTVASTLINSIWMLLLYIKMYGKIKLTFDLTFLRELLKSSIPITFSNFFVTILNTLNILMLGILKSNQETGYYKAAFQTVLLTVVPTVIIQNAFFPLISRSDSLEDRQKVMKKFFLLIFLIGTIVSVGFYTYSDYLILTIFGKDYIAAANLMRILMLSSVIIYINTGTTVPLIGWKKEKLVMYSIITGGMINIGLNFAMIPPYGAVGAAWATVISESSICIGLSYHFF